MGTFATGAGRLIVIAPKLLMGHQAKARLKREEAPGFVWPLLLEGLQLRHTVSKDVWTSVKPVVIPKLLSYRYYPLPMPVGQWGPGRHLSGSMSNSTVEMN